MKDFIIILLILILTGFAIGITYILFIDRNLEWYFLYIPWLILTIMLGLKIDDTYK